MTQVKWSHSALKNFESCPRKYQEVNFLKMHPHKDTQATLYGTQVHEAIENYIGKGTPIPPAYAQFKPVVDAVLSKPGRRLPEHEMALTKDLRPCGFKDEDVWVRGIADILIVDDENMTAYVGDWKGLAVDTPIPTPQGWTTMGDVCVGDTLFSESGDVCTVVGKSEVKNLRCYRITFDDTTTVVCDEEHLWKLADGRVVNVKELRGKKQHSNDKPPSRIALAAPIATGDVDLGVDPYVFGLWLADGKHTSGELSKPDAFVWEEIQRRGYSVNMATGGSACPARTVKGLSKQLRALGVLGNKHIPQQFLRAGYTQRLDLLRGLMDGDGNANSVRGQAIFTSTKRGLSDSVCELLCSLGQRPLLSTTTQRGFGLTVTAHPVSFRPFGLNPFLLPRKADRILPEWALRGKNWRQVVCVEEVTSVPTQCIAVNSADRTFLCTRRMVPTHNTGSNKYPDRDQLVLMSLMVFAHFPHIRKVNAALFFLVKNDMVKLTLLQEQAAQFWWKYRERVAKIENCISTGVWNPKSSPLCPWCPCTSCEHHPRH